MPESLYRRNPKEGNVIEIMRARRKLLNATQTVNGKSASVRNPAWVKITGRDKSCGGGGSMALPESQDTWDETYKPTFKPRPNVESVTLEYGGDWGLARKVSAQIRCFTIKDFEEVQQYFLLPGNEIDVEFGYKKTWGAEQPNKKITNLSIFITIFKFLTIKNSLLNFKNKIHAIIIKNVLIKYILS